MTRRDLLKALPFMAPAVAGQWYGNLPPDSLALAPWQASTLTWRPREFAMVYQVVPGGQPVPLWVIR